MTEEPRVSTTSTPDEPPRSPRLGLWIHSCVSLGRHPKTRALMRELRISKYEAIGLLHVFWHWVLEFEPDGDLVGLTNQDIADAAEWEGDPDFLVNGLVEVGWLDADEQGLQVHDWADYQGRLLKAREQSRERMARKRTRDRLRSSTRATNAEVTRKLREERESERESENETEISGDAKSAPPRPPRPSVLQSRTEGNSVARARGARENYENAENYDNHASRNGNVNYDNQSPRRGPGRYPQVPFAVKREVAERLAAGEDIAKLATELQRLPATLRKWLKDVQPQNPSPTPPPAQPISDNDLDDLPF